MIRKLLFGGFLILVLFCNCESEKQTSTIITENVVDQSAVDSPYKMEFSADDFSPGSSAQILGCHGYIMIQGGSAYINGQLRKRGDIIVIQDTTNIIALENGSSMWRWLVCDVNNPQGYLNSAVSIPKPKDLNIPSGASQMESLIKITEKIQPLSEYAVNGEVVIRMEQLSILPGQIINTVRRGGPTMTVLVSGDLKVQTPENEDKLYDPGDYVFESMEGAVNFVTYEASELLCVSVLPGGSQGQLIELPPLISKSTGASKGSQKIIMEKVVRLSP